LVARALPVQFGGTLALPVLERVEHAARDVGRLCPDGHRDAAGSPVVTLGRGVVPDLEDLLPDDPWDVHVGFRGHLAGHMDLAGGDQGLDRDMAGGVVLEDAIKDGITDLVGHLVRMALRNRFGGEEATGHLRPFLHAGRVRRSLPGGNPHSRRYLRAGSRAATRSQTISARTSLGPRGTSVTAPSAARIRAALSVVPARCPAPTWLTTSRSQPLAASLSRPCPSRSPVSAANPTMTWPGRRAATSSRSTSGFSTSRSGGGPAGPFLIFVALRWSGR